MTSLIQSFIHQPIYIQTFSEQTEHFAPKHPRTHPNHNYPPKNTTKKPLNFLKQTRPHPKTITTYEILKSNTHRGRALSPHISDGFPRKICILRLDVFAHSSRSFSEHLFAYLFAKRSYKTDVSVELVDAFMRRARPRVRVCLRDFANNVVRAQVFVLLHGICRYVCALLCKGRNGNKTIWVRCVFVRVCIKENLRNPLLGGNKKSSYLNRYGTVVLKFFFVYMILLTLPLLYWVYVIWHCWVRLFSTYFRFCVWVNNFRRNRMSKMSFVNIMYYHIHLLTRSNLAWFYK